MLNRLWQDLPIDAAYYIACVVLHTTYILVHIPLRKPN